MGTKIGIGFSNHINVQKAAETAAFQAKNKVDGEHIHFAILFSTIHYDPKKMVPIIHKIIDKPKMIGCSTAGIILSNSIETRGIGILAIHSTEFQFGVGSVKNLDPYDMHRAGTILAKNTVIDFGESSRNLFVFFCRRINQK